MKTEQRQRILDWIHAAQEVGARQSKACEVIGISCKTVQRWQQANDLQDGRLDSARVPSNQLSDQEEKRIIELSNQAEYADLAPSKIVPKLADIGVYIASESSFYRVLKKHNQLTHRGKSKPKRKVTKPKALTATEPNQIYTWDITYLPSTVRGTFFYLYLVMDIFSRKVVGWQVHSEERSHLAAQLMTDICLREKVAQGQVTLHSDNGSPMKGATLLATLQQLGVVPSFSRPSVSNDNPFSESLFRTLKYQPGFPDQAFNYLSDARDWVAQFVDWYNHEHRHSGIKFVTPAQRHAGEDKAILAKRELVYQQAKLSAPERWSGNTRNWQWIDEVYLNPEKCKSINSTTMAA